VDCGSCLAGPLVDRLTDAQPKLLVAAPAGPGRPAALLHAFRLPPPLLRASAWMPRPRRSNVSCAIYLALWLSAVALIFFTAVVERRRRRRKRGRESRETLRRADDAVLRCALLCREERRGRDLPMPFQFS
jgi:hypothetical protein